MPMFVAIVHLDLHIPQVRSLKHKRSVVKALKNKVRENVNVSVIETDFKNKWQRAMISVAMLRQVRAEIDSGVESLLDYLRGYPEVELLDWEVEVV